MSPRPGQKTVLITGCTPGGIGHALCHEFHKRDIIQDLHVIATARNPAVLTDLADLGMTTMQLDVTDEQSIASCHEKATKVTGGKLDILVNNAGRPHTHPALDIDLPDVRETFETNVFGVMAMVAKFGDLLITAKGLIINIASLAAVTPYVFGSVFSATKGAIISYSRTLRQELRPFGVRVTVLMAGIVASDTRKLRRPLPEGSFYLPVRELFEEKLGYSRGSATVTTAEYAADVVEHALRPEVSGFWRSFLGRPDWYWSGGKARLVYWGWNFFGEWVIDAICWKTFKLERLQRIVEDGERTKKLT